MSQPPQALLDALAADRRMAAPPRFDKDGVARLLVNRTLSYHLRYTDGVEDPEDDPVEAPLLWMEADLGLLPSEGPARLEMLETLTKANYCGGGAAGGLLALHPATGRVTLGHVVPLPETETVFLRLFAASVRYAEYWADRLRRAGTAADLGGNVYDRA